MSVKPLDFVSTVPGDAPSHPRKVRYRSRWRTPRGRPVMVDVPRTMMGLELQAVCHAADVAEPGNKGTTAWQFLDLNQPHCIQTTTLTVQGLDQKPCFFLYYGHCPNTEDVSPGFDDLPEWGDEWEM